jgi:hypothetical protein
MTPFEKRCELINKMFIATFDYAPYTELRYEEDLFIYGAVATHMDLVVPHPLMVAHINRVFESWLYMVGKEDTGFDSIYDIDPDLAKIDFEFFEEDLRNKLEEDEYIKIDFGDDNERK